MNTATIVFPEIRLVTYDTNNRVVPVVSAAGDYITQEQIRGEDKTTLKGVFQNLFETLLRHISVRVGGGEWGLPENHNSHPSIPIARQLLNACETGKYGYRCVVSDDVKNPGRKYLLFQIDKVQK